MTNNRFIGPESTESVNDFLAAEQTYAVRHDDPDYWFELANRHDIEAAEEWAHRQERKKQ